MGNILYPLDFRRMGQLLGRQEQLQKGLGLSLQLAGGGHDYYGERQAALGRQREQLANQQRMVMQLDAARAERARQEKRELEKEGRGEARAIRAEERAEERAGRKPPKPVSATEQRAQRELAAEMADEAARALPIFRSLPPGRRPAFSREGRAEERRIRTDEARQRTEARMSAAAERSATAAERIESQREFYRGIATGAAERAALATSQGTTRFEERATPTETARNREEEEAIADYKSARAAARIFVENAHSMDMRPISVQLPEREQEIEARTLLELGLIRAQRRGSPGSIATTARAAARGAEARGAGRGKPGAGGRVGQAGSLVAPDSAPEASDIGEEIEQPRERLFPRTARRERRELETRARSNRGAVIAAQALPNMPGVEAPPRFFGQDRRLDIARMERFAALQADAARRPRRPSPFGPPSRPAPQEPAYVESEGRREDVTSFAIRRLQEKTPDEQQAAFQDMAKRPEEYRRRGVDVDAVLRAMGARVLA